MEVIFAQEEINAGDIVMLNERGHLVKYRVNSPLGVAARRIRKGDAAMLDRTGKKGDVVTKGPAILKNYEPR